MTTPETIKILFVCMGNICRSPAAESIMNKLISDNGEDQFITTDSAGTSQYHIGGKSDYRMIAAGTKRGYKFEHRARQITRADFYDFTYIVAMDSSNYGDIQEMAPPDSTAIIRMMLDNNRSVPDPYYGGLDGFENVLNILEISCRKFLDEINCTHS